MGNPPRMGTAFSNRENLHRIAPYILFHIDIINTQENHGGTGKSGLVLLSVLAGWGPTGWCTFCSTHTTAAGRGRFCEPKIYVCLVKYQADKFHTEKGWVNRYLCYVAFRGSKWSSPIAQWVVFLEGFAWISSLGFWNPPKNGDDRGLSVKIPFISFHFANAISRYFNIFKLYGFYNS